MKGSQNIRPAVKITGLMLVCQQMAEIAGEESGDIPAV
jgi:hypothetical protein